MKSAYWLAPALLGAAIAAMTGPARADEPIFGYVYTTDLLPQGKSEFEQWITSRYRQAQGTYNFWQMRSEYEYGITDNLQGSLYLNYSTINANNNQVGGGTSGLGIPENHDPASAYRKTRFDGVSAEFIYRILSPYKDPFGLAVYIEPEWGPNEQALELRLIGQKNFLDDRLVFAANVWVEGERERHYPEFGATYPDPAAIGKFDHHTMLELDLGLSYRFASNWRAGLEVRNHNEYETWSLCHCKQEHTAWFAGPNIHYGSRDWFFTLTVLPQIYAKGFNAEQRAVIKNNLIYGDEHARFDGIRLKVGFFF